MPSLKQLLRKQVRVPTLPEDYGAAWTKAEARAIVQETPMRYDLSRMALRTSLPSSIASDLFEAMVRLFGQRTRDYIKYRGRKSQRQLIKAPLHYNIDNSGARESFHTLQGWRRLEESAKGHSSFRQSQPRLHHR